MVFTYLDVNMLDTTVKANIAIQLKNQGFTDTKCAVDETHGYVYPNEDKKLVDAPNIMAIGNNNAAAALFVTR